MSATSCRTTLELKASRRHLLRQSRRAHRSKRVLVVSYEGVNRGLRQPVCALITSRDRERSLATYVAIEPTDTNTGRGVRETSYVLCHYLVTLPDESLDEEPEALLSGFKMIEVRDALRVALDLG